MGLERKAITFKAIAENEAWLEAEVSRLNDALREFLPDGLVEITKSGVINGLVSMARAGEIQLPLSACKELPSLPGTPTLAVRCCLSHSGTEIDTREGSVCQELPNSTGAVPRKADSRGSGLGAAPGDQRRLGADKQSKCLTTPSQDRQPTETESGNGTSLHSYSSAEMPTAPIPLPKKLRRAERAS